MQTSRATLRAPVSMICAVLLAALATTIGTPGMASAAPAPHQSSHPVVSGSPAGDLGSFGISVTSTDVTPSATDTEASTSSGTFDVTVVDTTPPVLTLPADLTTAATGASGAVAQFTATAVDLVSGSTPVICSPASGSTLPIGKTSVSCSSTDDAGNTATGSFTFSVIDYMVPEITVDAPTSVRATSPRGARVTFRASAIDPIYGAVPVDCDPQSGSLFPVGTTTVTCIAYSMPPGDKMPALRPDDFVLNLAVLPFDIVVLPYQAAPITSTPTTTSTRTSRPDPTTRTSPTTRPSPATGTSRATGTTSTGTTSTGITSPGTETTVPSAPTVRTTRSTVDNAVTSTVAPTTRTRSTTRELAATGSQVRTPLTAALLLLLAGTALVIGARSAGRRRPGGHRN